MCGCRKLLEGTSDARGGPSTEENCQKGAGSCGNQGGGTDVLLQFDVGSAGVGDDEDAQQLIVQSKEWNSVDGLFITGGPLNYRRSFLMLPPNLIDERLDAISFGHVAGSANQKVRRKSASQVLIEHCPHSHRQLESGEKLLVNPPAANDVKWLIAHLDLSSSRKPE